MYGGIDAHKKYTFLAVIGPEGKREPLLRVETTRDGLRDLAKQAQTLKIAIVEASTTGKIVARVLRELGVQVDLIHADALVAAVRRNKSDALDAYDLARIAMMGAYTKAYIPTPEEEELRSLTARRVDLRGKMTKITCQLKAMAQGHLLAEPPGSLDRESCRKRWMKLEVARTDKEILESRLREYTLLHDEWETLQVSIHQVSRQFKNLEIITTLPGVDVSSVAGILGITGNPNRYPSADHYAASTGLTPSKKESGGKDQGGRITKKGNTILRTIYVECAWQIVRFPGPLRNQYRRLTARKGAKKAIVAIARKLAKIVWHMLTRNEPYRHAIEKNAEVKSWKIRAVRTLTDEGNHDEARRILRSHDPHREKERWESKRGRPTT